MVPIERYQSFPAVETDNIAHVGYLDGYICW